MRRAVALVVLALALAGCRVSGGTGTGFDAGTTDDGFYGAVLGTPYTAPATSLVGPGGQPFSLAQQTVPLRLVFFGYTHCPDVCATVMSTLGSAYARLDASQQKQVQVVFVTTDPARDTTSVMNDYTSRFSPDFVGVTGTMADIVAAGKALGVPVDPPSAATNNDPQHGSQVVALDPQHRSRIVWTYGTSAAQFATDWAKILDGGLK